VQSVWPKDILTGCVWACCSVSRAILTRCSTATSPGRAGASARSFIEPMRPTTIYQRSEASRCPRAARWAVSRSRFLSTVRDWRDADQNVMPTRTSAWCLIVPSFGVAPQNVYRNCGDTTTRQSPISPARPNRLYRSPSRPNCCDISGSSRRHDSIINIRRAPSTVMQALRSNIRQNKRCTFASLENIFTHQRNS